MAFSVCSAEDIDPNLSQLTVGRQKEHRVHVTVLNCRANPLVTHISTMCFSAKESFNGLHSLFFFFF